MKLKLLFLIIAIVIIGLSYRTLTLIRDRYPSVPQKIEINPNTVKTPENTPEPENQPTQPSSAPVTTIDESGTLPNINALDCDSQCENFKDNAANLSYCQQVCGLTPAKNDSDCTNKTGLEKDYCLKDLGIAKKDFTICDQIKDKKIQQACKDRLTEDIIEQLPPQQ